VSAQAAVVVRGEWAPLHNLLHWKYDVDRGSCPSSPHRRFPLPGRTRAARHRGPGYGYAEKVPEFAAGS